MGYFKKSVPSAKYCDDRSCLSHEVEDNELAGLRLISPVYKVE